MNSHRNKDNGNSTAIWIAIITALGAVVTALIEKLL